MDNYCHDASAFDNNTFLYGYFLIYFFILNNDLSFNIEEV